MNRVYNNADAAIPSAEHQHTHQQLIKYCPSMDELDTRPWVCEVSPGDVLYNPAGYWHEVVSMDACVSVSVPFDLSRRDVNEAALATNLLF